MSNNAPGTVNESDLTPFRDDTRDADNPMNMLREFLGISLLIGGGLAATDAIAGASIDIVGNNGGGLEGIAIEQTFQSPAPDQTLDVTQIPGMSAPTGPGMPK